MKFTKMHALGNDYIYIYSDKEPENPSALSKKLSDRHFGIGGDGIIYILPSKLADFKMRIFNADGSEAKMCGNGIRCVGKYVYDHSLTDKRSFTVETASGIKKLSLTFSGGKVNGCRVEMGKAEVSEEKCIRINDKNIYFIPVSVGNPHAVIFGENFKLEEMTEIANILKEECIFPDGVNTEFAEIIDDKTLRVRVIERGSGLTFACGTGACASVAAAVKSGFLPSNKSIKVILDGGTLTIKLYDDFSLEMTGPAETVFHGETEV